MLKQKIVLLASCCLICNLCLASHEMGGTISYRHTGISVSDYKYEITVTTYTKETSFAGDRCFLPIDFGDGTFEDTPRINGVLNICSAPSKDGESLTHGVHKNIYQTEHTYPAPGQYIISMTDPNRIYNISNMTNSGDTPFYIESQLIVASTWTNSSVSIQNADTLFGSIGQTFVFDPLVQENDGDSLYFLLITPISASGYVFPDQVGGGIFSLDQSTGIITWDNPQVAGVYDFAVVVEEYRSGNKIGQTMYDYLIFISTELGMQENTSSSDDIKIYPNPFHSYTTLLLDMNNDWKELSLTIYDVTGRESYKISGIKSREIRIERNNLPSGVFFYVLSSGGEIIQRGKLVIL